MGGINAGVTGLVRNTGAGTSGAAGGSPSEISTSGEIAAGAAGAQLYARM
eukprot:IDg18912t1